jgi:hypothetical protein
MDYTQKHTQKSSMSQEASWETFSAQYLWIKAYHGLYARELEQIELAAILPHTLAETVAEYCLSSPVRVRIQHNLSQWPWLKLAAVPLVEINMELSDTLSTVVVAFQKLPTYRTPPSGSARLVLAQNIPLNGGKTIRGLDYSEGNEVEFTMPNLNRQLGEALHGMGVTWRQLHASQFVVHVRLDYIKISTYFRKGVWHVKTPGIAEEH